MPDLAPSLEPLLAAVAISPRGGVSLHGRLVAERTAPRRTVLRRLRRALYEEFHAGRPATGGGEPYPDERFRERLEGAAGDRWTVDPGWTVVAADDGKVLVEKEGLRLSADPGRHLADRAAAIPGATVTLRVPAERPAASPGFFTVVASGGAPTTDVVRFYLNMPAGAAPAFVAAACRRLDATPAQWALKTLADPGAYGRRDGTVVYAAAAHTETVAEGLADAVAAVPIPALTDLPPLTLALTPTIGFAEDPPDGGMSFGEHRMDVIARSLLASRSAPPARCRSRLVRAMLAAGIDPAAPYRNRASERSRS